MKSGFSANDPIELSDEENTVANDSKSGEHKKNLQLLQTLLRRYIEYQWLTNKGRVQEIDLIKWACLAHDLGILSDAFRHNPEMKSEDRDRMKELRTKQWKAIESRIIKEKVQRDSEHQVVATWFSKINWSHSIESLHNALMFRPPCIQPLPKQKEKEKRARSRSRSRSQAPSSASVSSSSASASSASVKPTTQPHKPQPSRPPRPTTPVGFGADDSENEKSDDDDGDQKQKQKEKDKKKEIRHLNNITANGLSDLLKAMRVAMIESVENLLEHKDRRTKRFLEYQRVGREWEIKNGEKTVAKLVIPKDMKDSLVGKARERAKKLFDLYNEEEKPKSLPKGFALLPDEYQTLREKYKKAKKKDNAKPTNHRSPSIGQPKPKPKPKSPPMIDLSSVDSAASASGSSSSSSSSASRSPSRSPVYSPRSYADSPAPLSPAALSPRARSRSRSRSLSRPPEPRPVSMPAPNPMFPGAMAIPPPSIHPPRSRSRSSSPLHFPQNNVALSKPDNSKNGDHEEADEEMDEATREAERKKQQAKDEAERLQAEFLANADAEPDDDEQYPGAVAALVPAVLVPVPATEPASAANAAAPASNAQDVKDAKAIDLPPVVQPQPQPQPRHKKRLTPKKYKQMVDDLQAKEAKAKLKADDLGAELVFYIEHSNFLNLVRANVVRFLLDKMLRYYNLIQGKFLGNNDVAPLPKKLESIQELDLDSNHVERILKSVTPGKFPQPQQQANVNINGEDGDNIRNFWTQKLATAYELVRANLVYVTFPDGEVAGYDLKISLEDYRLQVLNAVQNKKFGIASLGQGKEREQLRNNWYNMILALANTWQHMLNKNMVLLGGPGIGKTTMARVYAFVISKLGLVLDRSNFTELSVTDFRSTLVSGSTFKTEAAILNNLERVVFVDEAYQLAPARNQEPEIINQMVTILQDLQGMIIVILAGYEDKMKQLFRLNGGMDRRFIEKFVLAEFSPAELKSMLIKTINDKMDNNLYDWNGNSLQGQYVWEEGTLEYLDLVFACSKFPNQGGDIYNLGQLFSQLMPEYLRSIAFSSSSASASASASASGSKSPIKPQHQIKITQATLLKMFLAWQARNILEAGAKYCVGVASGGGADDSLRKGGKAKRKVGGSAGGANRGINLSAGLLLSERLLPGFLSLFY